MSLNHMIGKCLGLDHKLSNFGCTELLSEPTNLKTQKLKIHNCLR